jgi:hypothetical protein
MPNSQEIADHIGLPVAKVARCISIIFILYNGQQVQEALRASTKDNVMLQSAEDALYSRKEGYLFLLSLYKLNRFRETAK